MLFQERSPASIAHLQGQGRRADDIGEQHRRQRSLAADGRPYPGQELLDLLEDVRRGLLTGVIPASKLNGLIAAVRSEQAAVTDPKLKSILDEIDLRASVELEKLGLDSGL